MNERPKWDEGGPTRRNFVIPLDTLKVLQLRVTHQPDSSMKTAILCMIEEIISARESNYIRSSKARRKKKSNG